MDSDILKISGFDRATLLEPYMLHRLLFITLALLAMPSAAEDNPFLGGSGRPLPGSFKEPKGWSEVAAGVPPWPDDADLIPITVARRGGAFSYWIDGRHLDVGDDEVVRYTVVAESAAGVRNVAYEGIRCTVRGQYRVYAYGIAGRFEPTPKAAWQSIEKGHGGTYRGDLWGTYFCASRRYEPHPRERILRALRRGHVSPAENASFLGY